MRTVLVNRRRSRPKHRRRTGGTIIVHRNALLAANPRRRRRHRRRNTTAPALFMTNPRRRRRRRYSNPLILPNRRRYRRRNPGMSGIFSALWTGALGGGVAYAFNRFVVRKIQLQPDMTYPNSAIWWHIGARAIAAALGGMFLPEKIASGANGALAFASFNEIEQYMAVQSGAALPGPSGADLSGLEADLSDVLDGY